MGEPVEQRTDRQQNSLTFMPGLTHTSNIEDECPENRPVSGDLPVRPSSPTPLPWFLPGGIRIRGGAARKFASVRRFHRGIQAEST